MKVSELKQWPKVYKAFAKTVVKGGYYSTFEDFLSSKDSEDIDMGFKWNLSEEDCDFWCALEGDDIEKAKSLQPHLFDEEVDYEGFIKWNGGEMPVPEGTMVHVKYRNGRKSIVTAGLCDSDETFMQIWGHFTAINWDINSLGSAIVAYKLHTGDGYVDGVKVDKGTPENNYTKQPLQDAYKAWEKLSGDTVAEVLLGRDWPELQKGVAEDFKHNTRKSLNKLAVQGLITGDTISKFDELLKEI